MPEGGSLFTYAYENMSARAAELLEWHLDNGTSANYLATLLTEQGMPISASTVKAWRRNIARPVLEGRKDLEQRALELALAQKQEQVIEKALRTNSPKVLVIDIERTSAVIQTRVWGANSLKGRRVMPDWVVERDRTICWAAKWHGSDEMMFAAEWEEGGREAMLSKAWNLLDEADIVVGHNVQSFDRKHLNGEFFLIGKPKPSPYKIVDTLLVARREFNFMHNNLDVLCKLFGIPCKTDKYSEAMAQAALAGDVEAQQRLRSYNEGDIHATDALYALFRFRGWISTHPLMAPFFPLRCQNCGGGKLEKMPKPYVAQVMVYEQYRCPDCGVVQRDRIGTRVSDLRPVSTY